MRCDLQMLMQVYDKLVKCDELLPVAANEVRRLLPSSKLLHLISLHEGLGPTGLSMAQSTTCTTCHPRC